MSKAKVLTAIQKRAQSAKALAPFALHKLKEELPLVLVCDPNLPPSPKPRYRSAYRYLGVDDLDEETLESFSPFEICVRLFDYSSLESLLAAHMYVVSAKGQVPFHPVSMCLLSLFRRERNLSRHEVLRILRHPAEDQTLRHCTGFENEFPGESGLRYFEGQLGPELQLEINALHLLLILHSSGLGASFSSHGYPGTPLLAYPLRTGGSPAAQLRPKICPLTHTTHDPMPLAPTSRPAGRRTPADLGPRLLTRCESP